MPIKHPSHIGSIVQRIDTVDSSITKLANSVQSQLTDICSQAKKHRASGASRQHKKPHTLFSGTSDTEKIMAAQVLAASIGLDLFRCNLAQVVSKYIRESSENIERVFSTAAHMDIVLFFDEADALFGKRTEIDESHDRYAEPLRKSILHMVKTHPGLIIFSSSHQNSLDPEFIRRLRYILEFPVPDISQRERTWGKELQKYQDKSLLWKILPKWFGR